jgi:hypothetical protein
MMPKRHALVSLGTGLLGWAWSGSPITLPLSIVVGVLVDLDHIADYAWLAISNEHCLILPLHGYELMPALWWAVRGPFGNRVATSVTLSYFLHLLSDEVENETQPGAYSLIWRAVNGFRLEALSRNPLAGKRGRQRDLDMLKRMVLQFGRLLARELRQ